MNVFINIKLLTVSIDKPRGNVQEAIIDDACDNDLLRNVSKLLLKTFLAKLSYSVDSYSQELQVKNDWPTAAHESFCPPTISSRPEPATNMGPFANFHQHHNHAF